MIRTQYKLQSEQQGSFCKRGKRQLLNAGRSTRRVADDYDFLFAVSAEIASWYSMYVKCVGCMRVNACIWV